MEYRSPLTVEFWCSLPSKNLCSESRRCNIVTFTCKMREFGGKNSSLWKQTTLMWGGRIKSDQTVVMIGEEIKFCAGIIYYFWTFSRQTHGLGSCSSRGGFYYIAWYLYSELCHQFPCFCSFSFFLGSIKMHHLLHIQPWIHTRSHGFFPCGEERPCWTSQTWHHVADRFKLKGNPSF